MGAQTGSGRDSRDKITFRWLKAETKRITCPDAPFALRINLVLRRHARGQHLIGDNSLKSRSPGESPSFGNDFNYEGPARMQTKNFISSGNIVAELP